MGRDVKSSCTSDTIKTVTFSVKELMWIEQALLGAINNTELKLQRHNRVKDPGIKEALITTYTGVIKRYEDYLSAVSAIIFNKDNHIHDFTEELIKIKENS